MSLSVVIPTHNRPAELERCLRALAAQAVGVPFEVIVVDDGSTPPARVPDGMRLLRREVAGGPASARNHGAHAATGEVLVFTDDDTIPARGWLAAVADHLERNPADAGVMGRTESPPYDPLLDHTIDHPEGALVTCNIAYRRAAFQAAGSFDESYPHAHCEDLDLGIRVLRMGTFGFAPAMRVAHPPHRLTVGQQIRRARMFGSEVRLRERHPEHFGDYSLLPLWLRPPVSLLRDRVRLLRQERRRSPRRVALWGTVTAGQVWVAFTACAAYRFGGTRR